MDPRFGLKINLARVAWQRAFVARPALHDQVRTIHCDGPLSSSSTRLDCSGYTPIVKETCLGSTVIADRRNS